MARARNTRRGRLRRQAPRNFWLRPAQRVHIGQEQFRVIALRGQGKSNLTLDPIVENVSWEDASALMEGDLQVREPAYRTTPLDLGEGHRIRLDWSPTPDAPFRPLWLMRIQSKSVAVGGGGLTFRLANDLAHAQRSKLSFKFKKNKQHPNGWTADQITRQVCRQAGVPYGKLPKGRFRIKNLVATTSPLDMVNRAWTKERTNTGRRFVISYRLGRLTITPFVRSRYLTMIGDMVLDASFERVMREDFATLLDVKATGGTRKHKRNIKVRVSSPGQRSRYGTIIRLVTAKDANTPAEARAYGRRQLAKIARPTRTLIVTHPGIATLWRGLRDPRVVPRDRREADRVREAGELPRLVRRLHDGGRVRLHRPVRGHQSGQGREEEGGGGGAAQTQAAHHSPDAAEHAA